MKKRKCQAIECLVNTLIFKHPYTLYVFELYYVEAHKNARPYRAKSLTTQEEIDQETYRVVNQETC